jgi:hypothetical protein
VLQLLEPGISFVNDCLTVVSDFDTELFKKVGYWRTTNYVSYCVILLAFTANANRRYT